MKAPIDALREVVRRGQAAQRAVDQVLAEYAGRRRPYTTDELDAQVLGPGPILVDDLPPWKRCDTCPRWTRKALCVQCAGSTSEPSARQGAPDGQYQPPARTVAASLVVGDYGRGPPAPGGRQFATKRRRR